MTMILELPPVLPSEVMPGLPGEVVGDVWDDDDE